MSNRILFRVRLLYNVLFLKIAVSSPSLIPCLSSPTDDRPTTDRRPTDDRPTTERGAHQLPVTKPVTKPEKG